MHNSCAHSGLPNNPLWSKGKHLSSKGKFLISFPLRSQNGFQKKQNHLNQKESQGLPASAQATNQT